MLNLVCTGLYSFLHTQTYLCTVHCHSYGNKCYFEMYMVPFLVAYLLKNKNEFRFIIILDYMCCSQYINNMYQAEPKRIVQELQLQKPPSASVFHWIGKVVYTLNCLEYHLFIIQRILQRVPWSVGQFNHKLIQVVNSQSRPVRSLINNNKYRSMVTLRPNNGSVIHNYCRLQINRHEEVTLAILSTFVYPSVRLSADNCQITSELSIDP